MIAVCTNGDREFSPKSNSICGDTRSFRCCRQGFGTVIDADGARVVRNKAQCTATRETLIAAMKNRGCRCWRCFGLRPVSRNRNKKIGCICS